MNRDLLIYFLVIIATAIGITTGGMRMLFDEVSRGRELGMTCLQLQAEQLAVAMKNGTVAKCNAGMWHFKAEDPNIPTDGRCFGKAQYGNGPQDYVLTCWSGNANPGRNRRMRFTRAGIALGGSFLISLITGLFLLARAAVRSRRQREAELKRVAELSHRLRTPLTSASICAELIASGKLDDAKRIEACASLGENARILGDRLEELISFTRAHR